MVLYQIAKKRRRPHCVFEVALSNEVIVSIFRCNRKSEIQDGAPKQCTVISASLLDSKAITTAVDAYTFSRLRCQMEPVATLYNEPVRNRKWKIKDGGLQTGNAYITATRRDSNAT